MLHLADVIQPKPDERVEAVFRRHRLFLVAPLLLASLFIALPFFFLFSLTDSGGVGIVALVCLIIAGLFLGWRTLFLWDANALILTNQRLVHVSQPGLWHRVVQEVWLVSVQELGCESRGIMETMFRIGMVRIRAAGSVQELLISRVSVPERIRASIEAARDKVKLSPASSLPLSSDFRTHVHALVDKASLSTLETVKALLEKHSVT